MKQYILIVVIGVSALFAVHANCHESEGGAVTYKNYFYNYPHNLPGDYIFRTGRVFFAKPLSYLDHFNPFSTIAREKNSSKGQGTAKGIEDKILLNEKVETLALQLISNSKEEIPDEYTITVTTFVNLNNLYKTSSLGRFISEQLIGEFQRAGVEVVEIRKTPSILVSKKYGEYALSRDMEELDFVHSAQAIVVGTYTISNNKVFINARLLNVSDGMVLSTAKISSEIDPIIQGFLVDEGMPAPSVAGSTIRVRSFSD